MFSVEDGAILRRLIAREMERERKAAEALARSEALFLSENEAYERELAAWKNTPWWRQFFQKKPSHWHRISWED